MCGFQIQKVHVPFFVQSSQGHKLGSQLQTGVTAGAGQTSQRRLPLRCSRLRAAQTLLIDMQQHFLLQGMSGNRTSSKSR